MYYVYILMCSDNTLYTGITTDIEKRVIAHNTKKTAAAYTKARRPVCLVYSEALGTKSEALKREYVIKQLTRKEKIELIDTTSSVK
jgi:putative endonuclease